MTKFFLNFILSFFIIPKSDKFYFIQKILNMYIKAFYCLFVTEFIITVNHMKLIVKNLLLKELRIDDKNE